MTFPVAESGVATSRPIELFRFTRELNNTKWLYSSSEEEVNIEGGVFLPAPVRRGDLEGSNNSVKAGVEIEIDGNTEFASFLVTEPVYDTLKAEIIRYQRDDESYAVIWNGYVSSFSISGNTSVIRCDPEFVGAGRPLNSLIYSAMCPHMLYSDKCGAAREESSVVGVIGTITGLSIVAPEFATKADGWFVGGYLSCSTGIRMILSHVGTAVTIDHVMVGAKSGDTFEAYAGCKHDKDDCKTKFDNMDNYGGFPFIPRKNPFDLGVK